MNHFENHFLFSESYIKEYIRESSKNNNVNDLLKNVFIQVKQWNHEFTKGDYQDDPWGDYIDAILDILGFKKQRKNQIVKLYTNTITDTEKPVAICYSLEKENDISSIIKGEYYAYQVIKAAKDHDVEWAMLTNGYRWRIYNTKNVSPFENYLEIDIEASIKNNQEPNKAFELFCLFFSSTTYYKEAGTLKIEKIKEESDKKAESIEDFLRGKAEGILTELCYGLKEDMGKDSFTEEDRKNIYNDAIILLYRLLFFGYAESRRLLPIKENDIQYSDSFYSLCKDAKDCINKGELYLIHNGYEYWERLDNQLRIYVDRTYNGGLFNNNDKPILSQYRIKNKFLVKCLAELSYKNDRNGQYIELIQYKDLSVRNLGAIYEGLLDYHLFIAEERMVQRKSNGKVKYIRESETTLKNSDLNNIIEPGGIYLSQDALERKESGSYYTPEDVVEYIVGNTVGKKMAELKVELKEELKDKYQQLSYEPTEVGKRIIRNTIDEFTKKFIENKILSLSIIDSAMGSGHFLVNAAYHVANNIVEIVSEHNWESEIDLPADIAYWKREVVENCIYGIDINELAVALAKLSLWLISASNNRALSFIDHHLKKGNSILGTDKTKVELIENQNSSSIFDVSYERLMDPVLNKYKIMKDIGSVTKDNVERQKELYEEILNELELLKRKFDYYLASQYHGGIKDEMKYAEIMYSDDMSVFEDADIKSLLNFAKENSFFHWELEFPDVMNNGGFDIAIGNPPYVEVKAEHYEYCVPTVKDTKNLYSYIMSRNIQYLTENGKLSFIVLMAAISSKKMKTLRKQLMSINGNVYFMNIDSATYPGRLFKGLMIRLSIITIENRKNVSKNIYTTNYKRFFQHERKNLFKDVNYTKIDKKNMVTSKDLFIPKIGSDIEYSILNKILNKTHKKISDFIDDKNLNNNFFFRNTGAVYYCMAFEEPPYYTVNGEQKISSTLTQIGLKEAISKYVPLSIFHSSLFYWFWTVYSDCYHFTKNDLYRLPIDLAELNENKDKFMHIFDEIKKSLNEHKSRVRYKKSFGDLEYDEFRHRNSKYIFDKVDSLLAEYYNLTKEELEYIVNYDFKYRVGE